MGKTTVLSEGKRNSLLKTLLAECTVLIKTSSDKKGTGFFIGRSEIITCSHVIQDYTENSSIYWDETEYFIERVEKSGFDNDLSIIYTNATNQYFALIGSPEYLGQDMYTFGFTNDSVNGESITLKAEGPGSGLYSVKDGMIKPGMSGAPVLDMNSGIVCGIIKKTKDPYQNLGGRFVPFTHTNINSFNYDFGDQKNLSSEWCSQLMQWQIENVLQFWKKHKKTAELLEDIYRLINGYKLRLFDGFVSGSKIIKISDLFNYHLIQEISGYDEYNRKQPDLINIIMGIAKCKGQGAVICADAGYGKTTLNYALFNELLDYWKEDIEKKTIPIFISVSTYISAHSHPFGSKEWFESYLHNAYYLSKSSIEVLLERKNIILIFDSIDEYLTSLSLNEIHEIFTRYIFTLGTNILSCRTNNYASYFQGIKEVQQLLRFQIVELDDNKIKDYVEHFFLRYNTETFKQKNRVLYYLTNNASVYDLARNPLHLNMLLDLLLKNVFPENGISNLRMLYENYVTEWLYSEEGKYPIDIQIDALLQVLERISWEFFEERQLTSGELVPFTKTRLKETLSLIIEEDMCDKLLEKLIKSSFLREKRRFNRSILSFTHRSFQEYFVASYIFHIMENDAETLGTLMKTYISSPVVSEFLRQYIQESNSDNYLKERLAANCMIAYLNNLNHNNETENEYQPRRIAREQIAYHMGIINSFSAIEFLKKMLKSETDVWVKRGIYLGLAYNNDKEYQDKYVDMLRKERKDNITSVENDCNIAFSLSFFGDQPLNAQNPDLETNTTTCSNMVKRMRYLLSTESDFSAWRLHLFTLIDIFNNRSNIRENLLKCLHENYDSYIEIIERLRKDKRCRLWPEVEELFNILSICISALN